MLKIILMAAGEGTRMKSNKSKVLHKILNKEIISYVYENSKIEDSQTIIIAGKNKDILSDMFEDTKIVEQKIGDKYPYGTGYAVSLATDYIDDEDDVLILNSDIPLIKKEALVEFINDFKNKKAKASVLSTKVEDPTAYGRIIRDKNNDFIKITEHRDLLEDQIQINEINTGIYIFKGSSLKKSLAKLQTNNDQNELYLTDCISHIKSFGEDVIAYVNDDYELFLGVNNKIELADASKIMQKRINEFHMLNGVIIENPDSVYIQENISIGKDTVISGPVKILGNTKIGENCIIEGSSRIFDSKIYDNVKIDNSVIEESIMEEGSDIGPYSHLRPKAHLGKNVHIGNFVEVKNAEIGENTKAGHLAYIGDADLGKNINVGCGVIFVNYDGKFKHRSIIGNDSFIGSNSNIVAPLKLEDEAYIAAGSTITKDVGKGVLAIERSDTKHIEGYVDKKKIRDNEKLKEKK